jgi:hypothetical protein
VQVAHDIHRCTWDARIFAGRLDRWDIFATRCQSAADSAESMAAFLEAVARKLEVGSLSGAAIARELREADSALVVRCFRDESVAVVALLRAEREEKKMTREPQQSGSLFDDRNATSDGGPLT